jgi:hypothetical protein
MGMANLPERYKTRATADALMSPSAIVLAGAGAAAAILGGLPIVAAAGVGAAAWAARVAFALPRRRRVERIDPFRVGEPWRQFVQEAVSAQSRFERTVERMRPGPLQDRLHAVGSRLSDGVRECWRIACQGDELQSAYQQLDVAPTEQELQQLEAEKRAGGHDPDHAASIDRAIDAVRSQLSSAKRIGDVADDTIDRLRVLNAQLDEAVARAVELSVHADSVGDVAPLGADVDSLVGELESLRQGLEETGGAAQGTASAT